MDKFECGGKNTGKAPILEPHAIKSLQGKKKKITGIIIVSQIDTNNQIPSVPTNQYLLHDSAASHHNTKKSPSDPSPNGNRHPKYKSNTKTSHIVFVYPNKNHTPSSNVIYPIDIEQNSHV